MVRHLLRESLEATISGKIGYVLAKKLRWTSKNASITPNMAAHRCSAYAACCIICHGRSNANAIKNAIRVAKEFADGEVNQRIEEELGLSTPHSAGQAD